VNAGPVARYVAQIHALLCAGHQLFPADHDGPRIAADDRWSIPTVPPHGGSLGRAADDAGADYGRTRSAVSALDADASSTTGDAQTVARQGRARSRAVVDTARAQSDAIWPAAGSPAGMRLIVSTMETRLAEIQREIDIARAQNRLLAARLHRLAAAYKTARVPLRSVSFENRPAWRGGRNAIIGYLNQALDIMGITDPGARARWLEGMLVLAEHESTYRTTAVNVDDCNAHGPEQADGAPLHATRGPFQVMPDTFAAYHQPGTSTMVWDPVASACAAMNYIMATYGVARDANNLRVLVAQTNPGVRHGY